jgi:probable O-glycosylation ligase (exosortase A-associated)
MRALLKATGRVRTGGWDFLLVCTAVYIAAAVGRIHQLFPVLLPLRPALVSAVMAIGLYFLQQTGERRLGLIRSSTTSWLLVLLLWSALSVPGALNQGLAFHAWTDFARTVLMFAVIAGSVRSFRDVERLTFVFFAVTVLYSVIVLSRFQLSGDNWRFAGLYDYDANDLATLIVTAMPLGLYFLVARRSPLVRVLVTLGLGALAVALIRSGSRGGLLAFLAVAAFILVGFTAVKARVRLAGLAVLLGVVFLTASDRYWAQMQTMLNPHEDYNLTADAGRVKIWKRGLGYMSDNPLFGVGMENFQVAEGTISPLARLQERGIGVHWMAAHNTFVQAGAEVGFPGVLCFVGVIGSALLLLRRLQRRSKANPATPHVSRLAQSLTAALIGFVVGAFFLSLAYADMLYALAALTVALAKTARSPGLPSPLAPPRIGRAPI